MTKSLLGKGFHQSKSDCSLFTRQHQRTHIFVRVYVDDLLIISDDSHGISNLKISLHNTFTIKDLGLLVSS